MIVLKRKELLAAAEARLGHAIPISIFNYIRQKGAISYSVTSPLGWSEYPPEAVDELISYCKKRSRYFAGRSHKSRKPILADSQLLKSPSQKKGGK